MINYTAAQRFYKKGTNNSTFLHHEFYSANQNHGYQSGNEKMEIIQAPKIL